MGVIIPNPTVETEDGATSVTNVKKIEVTDGKLTDDGSRIVSLDLSGGGGGTEIAIMDLSVNIPSGMTVDESAETFSINNGQISRATIGSANSANIPFLWCFYWPAENCYVKDLVVRAYNSTATGATSQMDFGFYTSNDAGYPYLLKGVLSFECTTTGGAFYTMTAAAGASIGPFARGDKVWCMFLPPRATQWSGAYAGVRLYISTVDEVVQSPTSPHGLGNNYAFQLGLKYDVNSGEISECPTDLTSTTAITAATAGGTPSTFTIREGPQSTSVTWIPAIQLGWRTTA